MSLHGIVIDDKNIETDSREGINFQGFPAEIRNNIYEIVLCGDGHVLVGDEDSLALGDFASTTVQSRWSEVVNLSTTCKQVHDKVVSIMPVFFETNTVHVALDMYHDDTNASQMNAIDRLVKRSTTFLSTLSSRRNARVRLWIHITEPDGFNYTDCVETSDRLVASLTYNPTSLTDRPGSFVSILSSKTGVFTAPLVKKLVALGRKIKAEQVARGVLGIEEQNRVHVPVGDFETDEYTRSRRALVMFVQVGQGRPTEVD